VFGVIAADGVRETIATASPLLSIRARKDSFYMLDGLRGVAAVAVLMMHADPLFRPVWMRSAYLAVDLFFALSGFVLAHAYGPRLMAGMTALAFVRLRLIRILPLYLLGTTIAVASALEQCVIGHGEWQMGALVRSIVAGALLVPLPPIAGAPNAFAFPLNIPAWSLFFELLVNFFYAAVFRFLTPSRTIVLVGIALAGLSGTTWYFGGLDVGSDWPTLWGGVPRVMFSFFAGVVLYQIAGTGRRPRRIAPWIMLPALLALFVLPVPAPFRWAFDLGCLVALFPLFIWYAATAEPGGPRQNAVLTLFGQTSYALYAIHVPLLGVLVGLLSVAGNRPGWFPALTGPMFLAVAIVCSLAADVWFDTPLRRLIAQMLPGAPLRSPGAVR
jgi:peptidoglycan/LPS O-acetylase OafA/YrhL